MRLRSYWRIGSTLSCMLHQPGGGAGGVIEGQSIPKEQRRALNRYRGLAGVPYNGSAGLVRPNANPKGVGYPALVTSP